MRHGNTPTTEVAVIDPEFSEAAPVHRSPG
jgi:hypothetical protein